MRRLVASFVVAFSLVACSGGGETLTEVDEGPFGGVYALRTVNDAPVPLYFWPNWYPGQSSTPGVLSTTLRSADLSIRPDGSFMWSTQLEEMARKPQSTMLEYVLWNVRREAYGTWSYTPSTSAVSLEGLDQTGPYVLVGSVTGNVLTVASTFPNGPVWTFLLER